jgi:type IV pilus biogenesis protein CpaD/CtpE
MFIIRNRAVGALAGITCAVLVTLFLGGCATTQPDTLNAVDAAARTEAQASAVDGGPTVCERYGPSGNVRSCGASQAHKAESLLSGMVR